MKRFLLASVLLLPLLLTGCVTDPVGQAAELRALYNEAQVQADLMCKDPNVDELKCQDLKGRLAQMSPFVDAIEVAAAAASKDPTKNIDFHALWVQYKPKVQSILIAIVLRRYLGV